MSETKDFSKLSDLIDATRSAFAVYRQASNAYADARLAVEAAHKAWQAAEANMNEEFEFLKASLV